MSKTVTCPGCGAVGAHEVYEEVDIGVGIQRTFICIACETCEGTYTPCVFPHCDKWNCDDQKHQDYEMHLSIGELGDL